MTFAQRRNRLMTHFYSNNSNNNNSNNNNNDNNNSTLRELSNDSFTVYALHRQNGS